MKKQIAKSFYKLSVFFDCTYAEHLSKSKSYDQFHQELSQVTIETIDIIGAWSQGNFTQVLPIRPDLWAAINDSLNFLVDDLVEEIKQLPDDHHIRRRFHIYETVSTVNNDSKNSFIDDNFDDLDVDDLDVDDLDDYTNMDSTLEQDIIAQNSDSSGSLRCSHNSRKENIFADLTATIHKIFGKSLGKLFFNFSIFFDKNYLKYLEKSQKYDQILETLSQENIAIIDVTERWSRGDLRERIEINYIHDFYAITNALNGFIDLLTGEIKKLPENSSFKQKCKLSQ